MRRLWIVALIPAAALVQWKAPWSYEGPRGPEHWATLDTAYAACAGREQSPVDIHAAVKVDLPALRFEYHTGPLEHLVNNGATIRVNYRPDNPNVLSVGETHYRLTQFHFHRPSEETIDGKSFDMVLHLMHESSDHKVVGVAVLLSRGAANTVVEKLWDHMPTVTGPEHDVPGVTIDPAALIPRAQHYYMYRGSLTAPPCTEGVTWFVLETPITVSQAQIDAFAKLYPHDIRPPQPLNGRVIQQSR